jgi:hypothetical protein
MDQSELHILGPGLNIVSSTLQGAKAPFAVYLGHTSALDTATCLVGTSSPVPRNPNIARF